jgi:hypothetical protein
MELKIQPTIHLQSKPGYGPEKYPGLLSKYIVFHFQFRRAHFWCHVCNYLLNCVLAVLENLKNDANLKKIFIVTWCISFETNRTNHIHLASYKVNCKTQNILLFSPKSRL